MSQSITSFVTGALRSTLIVPSRPETPTCVLNPCSTPLQSVSPFRTLTDEFSEAIPHSIACWVTDPKRLYGLDLRDCIHPEDVEAENTRVRALLSGERDSYKSELRYLRKDKTVFWGSNAVVLVRTDDGVPVAIIDMLEDITEYRQAQEQLAEAQKLEAIGRLVGAVAHDFNNLLTGIMLYCDLMSAETEPDSRVYRHASEVHLAAEHGAALVQQLLTITRKHVVDLIPICLNDTVTSMQNLLNRLIGEQIQLVFDLDPSLPQVLMDPTHAQQVVLNLVLNSRDAMPGGGRVVIGTRTCEQPTRTEGQTRQLVSLAVTDDGCGMDAETKTRLFEPFFTTKEAGKGNGLGLATVYRIVHDGGGSISVDSELGQGCRIEIVLPAVIKFGRTQSESHTLAHIQNAKG